MSAKSASYDQQASHNPGSTLLRELKTWVQNLGIGIESAKNDTFAEVAEVAKSQFPN